MADKFKIISDSSSDIPKELVDKYDIDIIPVLITVDDKTYKDYYEMTAEQFCEILKTCDDNTKFSTAQASLDTFIERFKKWTNDGYKIICFTISSSGSGTFQTANLAKQYLLDEGDCDIEIIDSKIYTYVYGRAVIEAAQMAESGSSKEEILNRINEILSSGNAFFVTDTLKFLKKGGRIKPAVAAIGEILNIKPILTVDDGVINSLEKVRGSKKVVPRIMELLKNTGFEKGLPLYIIDGGDQQKNDEMKKALSETFGIENAPLAKIGPTILLNTGPGLTGVLYYTKP